MTVTITPMYCRKDMDYRHQQGPEKDRRVRCGDLYRWSTGTETKPRICDLCRPLGLQLAYLGINVSADEYLPTWRDYLVWNLTLASLCNAAAEAALDDAMPKCIVLSDEAFDAFTADIQDPRPPSKALVDVFRTPAPVRSMMAGLACAQTECRHRGQCTNFSAPCVSERPLHEDDCRCEWCKVHA